MSREKSTVIIGGGVVGITTLYELSRRGERATLIEAESQIAGEASDANGGMLTASMPDPWNSPGVGRHLASSIFDPHSVMKLRLSVVPEMIPWGFKFLLNSTPGRHQAATRYNYQLARQSVLRTKQIAEELGLAFSNANRGTLKVFISREAMATPLTISDMLKADGLRYEILSREEIAELDPELKPVAKKLACGIYYPEDATGDSHEFSQLLANCAVNHGAIIKTRCSAKKILIQSGHVCGVETDRGILNANQVVIAAGIHSESLTQSLGLSLAIKPAKGYSVTVDIGHLDSRPSIPVIDDALHAVVTPLGDRLRFAGTAEFAGIDKTIRQERIDNLWSLFKRLYPHLYPQVNRENARAWAGLRPMSADGRPFIGRTGPTGLWVNTGHGHLGWTMAVGSAELLVSQMLRERQVVNSEPFDPNR